MTGDDVYLPDLVVTEVGIQSALEGKQADMRGWPRFCCEGRCLTYRCRLMQSLPVSGDAPFTSRVHQTERGGDRSSPRARQQIPYGAQGFTV